MLSMQELLAKITKLGNRTFKNDSNCKEKVEKSDAPDISIEGSHYHQL